MRFFSSLHVSATAAVLVVLVHYAGVICALSVASPALSVTVVDLQSNSLSNDTRVSVAAAAGLLNRQGPRLYLLWSPYDVLWLQRLLPNATLAYVDAQAWLHTLFSGADGESYPVIVYDSRELFAMPAVASLAGVLSAIPVSVVLLPLVAPANVSVVLNASGAWSSQRESLSFASSVALNATTTAAFQRPSDLVQGLLLDWIVNQRLFTQYLTEGCIPGTADHSLLREIVDASPWPRPIRVYGYNGLDVLFGGDLFEAETDCIHTMGQVATEQATNLAFWQHVGRFEPGETLSQVPSAPVMYNATKRYVALVYGDMDNIDFVQTFGSDHMEYRAARCNGTAAGSCFPLTWTLSPNLITFAPATMRWYYDTALPTQRDWFIMPPSGTLYSYPGEMDNSTQANYVLDQTHQATVMNTSGSVHWEWFFAWENAYTNYFPRYETVAGGGATTRAFFLNDVPWPIPIPDMWLEGITYRFFGNASSETAVVVFRPAFNWQEGGGGGLNDNATVVAELINQFPAGSVQYIYVIQNTDIASLFQMVEQLDETVELVSYETLVSLARQRTLAADAASCGSPGDDNVSELP